MFKENIGSLLFVLCLLPFTSFAQQNNFTVTGNIKGMGNDSMYMLISEKDNAGTRIADTIALKAQNDQFFYKGKIESTKSIWTSIGGLKSRKTFSFFVEKGNITINGDVNDLDNMSILGTPSNNDQTKSRKYTRSIYNRATALREKLKTVEAGSDAHKKMSVDIAAKYDSVKTYEVAFVKANPQSFFSAILLWVKQDNLPLDELENLYNAFPLPIQKSERGIDISNKITARKLVVVGNPAPDFTSTDTSGNSVKLSDFRGKYVLLEFWANWCVPCREEHPNLVAMYNKFNSQGFTIMQYSTDEKAAERKWKNAIIKDGLIWTHVSDLNAFESKVAKLYGVQPIPDNFLISPEGKILARGLRGEALNKKLEEIFN